MMLPLRPQTQALVQQIAALSGQPLEFMRDPTMNSGADFDAEYKMAVEARRNLR